MFCPVCDFCYFPGSAASLHAHAVAHHEWEYGVRLRRSAAFESIGEVDDHRVLLVRPTSSTYARRWTERVSRRSIREPIFEGGYDTPQYYADERLNPVVLHTHALMLECDGFGVGILVLERRPIVEYYRWTTRPHFELARQVENVIRWSVAHVWLLPSVRGRGIADELVRIAVRGVNETPDTIGWLSPITKRAYHLIARVTETGFHRAWQELPPSELVPNPFED